VTPLADIVGEGDRLLASAASAGVPLRLLGGLAVEAQVGTVMSPHLRRSYEDIDLATARGKARDVTGLLTGLGYEADEQFNALQSGRRLLLYDVGNARKVDVFCGSFEMCHAIPIADRLDADARTIPLAELLLTKLQVFELNEKDRRDLIALLLYVPIGHGDAGEINADVVAELLANDWGLWRTTRLNLDRVRDGVDEYELTEDERQRIRQRCDELWASIEARPKSRGWRIRDRVGDRKRWYQVPEEV
jgi:hypothetical protein